MFNLESIFNSPILNELVMSFVSGVPKFFKALLILIVGVLIARIIRKIIKKALERIGIDKIGEKLSEIEIIEKSNVTVKISTILSKVVYYLLVLMFLAAAADVLQMQAVSNLVSDAIKLVPDIIAAGIILIIGTLLADMLKSVAQTTMESLGIPSARLLASFIFYFLMINIIVVSLSQAGCGYRLFIPKYFSHHWWCNISLCYWVWTGIQGFDG